MTESNNFNIYQSEDGYTRIDVMLNFRVHSPVGERFRGSFAPSQAARHCVAAFGEELS